MKRPISLMEFWQFKKNLDEQDHKTHRTRCKIMREKEKHQSSEKGLAGAFFCVKLQVI